MEIIKHGKIEPTISGSYKLECTSCGCVFAFNSDDFTYQEKELNGFAGVRCPDCKTELKFKPSDWSEKIKVYCKNCNSFIGETFEYDDGYIPDPDGTYSINLSMVLRGRYGSCYTLNKDCICKSCYDEINNNVVKALEGLGFTK